MTTVLAILLISFGLIFARRFGQRQSLFGLLFVNYFIWHQFVPALSGERLYWSTDKAIGFTPEATGWALYFFISGLAIIMVISRDKAAFIPKMVGISKIDIIVCGIAFTMLIYYIQSFGLSAYIPAYEINCGNCTDATDIQKLLTRSLPRYVIWFYLVLWATMRSSYRNERTVRFIVAFVMGLIIFPPLGTTRYQYLVFALSLILLNMPVSRRSFSLVCILYPVALYFLVGAISFFRVGRRLPERISDFINSPDFFDFETLRVAIWYVKEQGIFSGQITLSSLFPLPRQLFPWKWEGTGVNMFNEGYITFPNVGFSPFSELLVDFGLFSIVLWPFLIYFLSMWFRINFIVFVGLLPIMKRGSLLAFSAPVTIIYVLFSGNH